MSEGDKVILQVIIVVLSVDYIYSRSKGERPIFQEHQQWGAFWPSESLQAHGSKS